MDYQVEEDSSPARSSDISRRISRRKVKFAIFIFNFLSFGTVISILSIFKMVFELQRSPFQILIVPPTIY